MSAVGARGAGARLPVTQAQLGAFTGLSGVHVCRTLGTLAREGAISRPGRGIVAGDLGRLAALARADIARLARDILAPPPDLAP
jgi:hypothetical protein